MDSLVCTYASRDSCIKRLYLSRAAAAGVAVGAGRHATVDTVDTAVLRPATLLKSRRSIASRPVGSGIWGTVLI